MKSYNFMTKLIRSFLTAIDAIFFELSGLILNLIFNISDVVINFEIVQPFINRMYFILTVYMLFKMSILLLTSIANPDMLTDSKVGMGKFAQRVITVFLILAFIPTVFQMMFDLQPLIIESLPKLILGTSDSVVKDDSKTRGESMALSMMMGFFTVNETCEEDVQKPEEWYDIDSGMATVGFTSLSEAMVIEDCQSTTGKTYQYNYSFFVSTAAALIMLFVLISFAIDVAIRVVKLTILQVIAPIPVITYIDPASDKTGAFNNWMKEVMNTYLEIFLKLATMYFLVYLMSEIFKSSESIFMTSSKTPIDTYAKIALAIGTLLFAKSLPNYIGQIFGLKMGGSLGLAAIGSGIGGLMGGGIGGALGSLGSTLMDGSSAMAEGKAPGAAGGFNKGKAMAKDPSKVDNPNVFQRNAIANQGRKKGYDVTGLQEKDKARNDARSKMQEQQNRLREAQANMSNIPEGDQAAHAQAQRELDVIQSEYALATEDYQTADSDYSSYKSEFDNYGGAQNLTFNERMWSGVDTVRDFGSGVASTVSKGVDSFVQDPGQFAKDVGKSVVTGAAIAGAGAATMAAGPAFTAMTVAGVKGTMHLNNNLNFNPKQGVGQNVKNNVAGNRSRQNARAYRVMKNK